MVELTEGKLSAEHDKQLKDGVCPACGSTKFYHLAWGGLAENIACENGHRFWYSPPFTSEYQGLDASILSRQG